MSEPVFTAVKEIRPGLKNINVVFIVLDIGKYKIFDLNTRIITRVVWSSLRL